MKPGDYVLVPYVKGQLRIARVEQAATGEMLWFEGVYWVKPTPSIACRKVTGLVTP